MSQIRRAFLLVAGASVLAACASHAPTNSTGTTSPGGSTLVAAAGTPDTGTSTIPKGYKRVVRRGTEYFCRMQPVTGSHTLKTEICLTQDELDAEKNHTVTVGLNPPAPGAGSPMPAR